MTRLELVLKVALEMEKPPAVVSAQTVARTIAPITLETAAEIAREAELLRDLVDTMISHRRTIG